MPKDQSRRRFCKRCERPRDEAGGELFSYRGLCPDCRIAGIEAQHAVAREQTTNPNWLRRWREGMARAAGALLREDVQRDS